MPLQTKTYVVSEYWPDQPAGEVLPGACIAGANAVFELDGFSRAIRGWGDQSETHAAQLLPYTASLATNGTITFSAGATARADLRPYQHILLGRLIFEVQQVVDDLTVKVEPPPNAAETGVDVRLVTAINPMTFAQPTRASQFAGRAERYREGSIVTVGSGELRLNGVALTDAVTGDPLIATSAPQMAYPLPTGGYDVRPMGFTAPAVPTVTEVVGGGTKGMPKRAKYQFRIAKRRKGFPGYGLVSLPVMVAMSADGNRFEVTAPAFDTTQGQTQFRLFVSRTDDLSASTTWRLYDFDTPGPHTVEWLDGELGEEVQIDNYPPPPGLFVFAFNDLLGVAGWGDAPDASGNLTVPGGGIALAKATNIEAFPDTAYAFIAPHEPICGVHVGKTQMYFLSANHLHIGRRSGNDKTPLFTLPFGHSGFFHQYSACTFEDSFFGLTGDRLVWVSENEGERNTYSEKVRSDLSRLSNPRSFVGYDGKNGWVVIFHSNDSLGAGGKWLTKCMIFNVRTQRWMTPAYYGDGTTTDFTVCSVATVGQQLYLATTDGRIWRWDDGQQLLTGFLALNFDDWGNAKMLKTIRRVKVNGGIHGQVQLYRDRAWTALQAGSNDPPSFTLDNPTPAPAARQPIHHRIWRPSFKCYSSALRFPFEAQGTRLLDSVEVTAFVRDNEVVR